MIRILIVDDHPLVRDGMASMLENEEDFKVLGACADGEDAVKFCLHAKVAPDVVVSDIRMPGMDGFALLKSLKKLDSKICVLLLAGMPLKVEEERARAEGAHGYLSKSIDWERLVSAIRLAAEGGAFLADDFKEASFGPLTPREREVLKYLAIGKTHEEIGIIHGISAETVRSHVKSILRKLDCTNAAAAVARAYELGILRA